MDSVTIAPRVIHTSEEEHREPSYSRCWRCPMTDCYNAAHTSATRKLLVRKVALAVILVRLASTSRHWPGDTRSLTVSLPWEEKIEEFRSDDTALTQVYKLWKGWNSARTVEHLY